MDELKHTLKQQIITMLNLDSIEPEDIEDNAPLLSEGLGLDSFDILELCWILEKYYGIRINNLTQDKILIFKSINTIADYISKNRTK